MPEFYVPNESRVTINIPVIALLARGLGPHRHHRRPRAGPAALEAGPDRRAEGEPQHGAGPGRTDARSARHRRSRAVGRAAGQRRADRPHLLRAAGHRHRHAGRARADGRRAAAAGEVPRRYEQRNRSRRICSSGSRDYRASRRQRSAFRSAGRQTPFTIVGQHARRVEAASSFDLVGRRSSADVRASRCARGRMFDAAEVCAAIASRSSTRRRRGCGRRARTRSARGCGSVSSSSRRRGC